MTDVPAQDMSEENAVDLIMQRLESEPKTKPDRKEQAQPQDANPADAVNTGEETADADGESLDAEAEEFDLDALEEDEAEAKKAQPVKADTPKTVQVAQQPASPQAYEAQQLLTRLTAQRAQLAYDPLVQRGADPAFWSQLATDDPLEWPKIRSEYENRLRALQQHDQAIGELSQREDTRILSEQRARLIEKFPEFNDPGRYQKFAKDAVTMLSKEYGFQSEEIDALNDHRAVALIRDAMKYRQAVLARQSAKTSASAKEVRPQASAVLKPQAKAAQSVNEAFQRLKGKALKTGRDDDRIDAVLAGLGQR